jgi:hypothetical protein
VVAMVLVSLLLDLVLFPLANPVKSGRRFANQALPYLNEADKRYLFGDDYSGVINLYTGITSIPILEGKDRRERLVAALRGREKVAVVSNETRIEDIRDLLPENATMPVREQLGHSSMVLICNWKRPGETPPPP